MYYNTTNIGERILDLCLDQGHTCAATLRRTLIAMGYTIKEAYNATQDAMHSGLVA